MQGYNAQAVCNEQQIVIAAEITGDSPDFGHLEPMISAAQRELHAAGVTDPLEVVVADTGYWHHVQMDELAMRDITVLISPDAGKRTDTRPGWDGGRYAFMRRVLATGHRRRAVRQTPGVDRTGLCQHEVQPSHRSLPTTRTSRVSLGMEAHQRDAQPPEMKLLARAPAGPSGREVSVGGTGPGALGRT